MTKISIYKILFWVLLAVSIVSSGFILGFVRMVFNDTNKQKNPAFIILTQNLLNSYQIIDYRLGVLEKRVNTIEQKVDTIEQKFDTVSQHEEQKHKGR